MADTPLNPPINGGRMVGGSAAMLGLPMNGESAVGGAAAPIDDRKGDRPLPTCGEGWGSF